MEKKNCGYKANFNNLIHNNYLIILDNYVLYGYSTEHRVFQDCNIAETFSVCFFFFQKDVFLSSLVLTVFIHGSRHL